MADVDFQGDRAVITIHKDTLTYAVEFYNDQNPGKEVKITDLDELFRAFCSMLCSEDSNGDDAINRMLDRVLQATIEYYGEGIEEIS